MMNDARNHEFKSRGRVNSSVRWRAELALMLIRNPNMDARMRWSAIIAVLWISHLVRAHICAAIRAGVCVHAKPMC